MDKLPAANATSSSLLTDWYVVGKDMIRRFGVFRENEGKSHAENFKPRQGWKEPNEKPNEACMDPSRSIYG